jgi:transposase
VASVAEAREFDSRRQFAAWLGLVPRQYSSGGKTRLGHITAKGDPYLRTPLVMGARSVLQTASRRSDHLAKWALAIKERRGYHRACVDPDELMGRHRPANDRGTHARLTTGPERASPCSIQAD